MALRIKTLAEIERTVILYVLHYHHGNRNETAATLDLSIRALRYKLNSYMRQGYPVPGNHNSVSLKDFYRRTKFLKKIEREGT